MMTIRRKIVLFFFIFVAVFFLHASARQAEVRNIILFIGDGMGPEQVRAAGMYLYGEEGTLIFESFPYQGQVTTYSANSDRTDSAASATAMSTGHKVNNGVIGMAIPGNGSELNTILEYYSSLGKSTGLVTRTYMTHATPAAFGAHEPSRSNVTEIGQDYFTQTCPTLLFGGGGFGVSSDLALDNGYTVVTTETEMESLVYTVGLRVSAQFGRGHMPYESAVKPGIPTLEEMTAAALSLLETNGKGFFLLVEGGRIDHACHANNIKNAVMETAAFHDAVSYAEQWAARRSDTLMVVTADHETGGLTVIKNNGKGNLPGVTWDSTGHTSQNVGIYATGPGSDVVGGIIDNTDVYNILFIPVYELTVTSASGGKVRVMINPGDNNGLGNGETDFTRTYNKNAGISLTAPFTANGKGFLKWRVNGVDYSSQDIQLSMTGHRAAEVYYTAYGQSALVLDKSNLNFGYAIGRNLPPAQTVTITKEGDDTFSWTAGTGSNRFIVAPGSGSGPGVITITPQPGGLGAGNYSGVITVTDAGNPGAPQTVAVNLIVRNYSQDEPPRGSFDTPVDGGVIQSSVPVTGWALDDVGLSGLTIYRDPLPGEGGGLVPVGEGYFVEGARPDIETLYPDYPANYKAGWGYMLLTNTLPGGDGTYTFHALAVDINGNETLLGSKTVTVNNAAAVKPFGAIDSPKMGEVVGDNNYRNQGWALTPPPSIIPIDGASMKLFIDGMDLGKLNYNVYRNDIASLFPGYSNSNGAMAYYDLDTGFFRNGIHTIAWQVTDNMGNIDGIGSRYFIISNESGARASRRSARSGFIVPGLEIAGEIPVSTYRMETGELEPVYIKLSRSCRYLTGYTVVGNQRRPLPVGSTLDIKTGSFYWTPGPGFTGRYRLFFTVTHAPGANRAAPVEQVVVTIIIGKRMRNK